MISAGSTRAACRSGASAASSADAPRFAELLTRQFGRAPTEKHGEKTRTLQWRNADERALLTTEAGERRATLLVWRGDFNDEIYKVR